MEYYADVLNSIGFNAETKIISAETYFTTIGDRSVKAQTGWANWFQDYPHPADFIDILSEPDKVVATGNNNYSYNAADKELADKINGSRRRAGAHAGGQEQWGRGRQGDPGEGLLGPVRHPQAVDVHSRAHGLRELQGRAARRTPTTGSVLPEVGQGARNRAVLDDGRRAGNSTRRVDRRTGPVAACRRRLRRNRVSQLAAPACSS